MAKATIKTIADEAGVSIATVSKALNDMPDISKAMKTRIREIAQRQGYVLNTAARQLAKGQPSRIGVIMPGLYAQDSADLCGALATKLQRADFTLHWAGSGGDSKAEAALVADLAAKGAEGIIIQPVTTEMRHIEQASAGRSPIVYVGGAVNPAAAYAVVCDEYKGGGLAAQALYQRGCRNAALLTFGDAATPQYERTRGFIAYMHEKGVPVRVYQQGAQPTEAAGAFLAHSAVQETMPQGMFCTHDLLALGALYQLRQLHISVPGQIQVMGYGDIPGAALQLIGLSTVAAPYDQIGLCAADMMLGVLSGQEDVAARLVLEPQLKLRQTTGEPR